MKIRDWQVLVPLIGIMLIGAAWGYFLGKHTADRWYAEHPVRRGQPVEGWYYIVRDDGSVASVYEGWVTCYKRTPGGEHLNK